MADTALNRYVMQGTAAQRAAYTPSPATVAAGQPLGIFWHETDTGRLYGWNTGTAAWQSLGGGVAAVEYISMPSFGLNGSSAFGSSFCAGRNLIVTRACTITDVCFYAVDAAATARVAPCIYSSSGKVISTLNQKGSQIIGVTQGVNEMPLTASVNLVRGDKIFIGMSLQVAAVNMGLVNGTAETWVFSEATGTPPNSPAATSYNFATWGSFWLKGTFT